MRYLNFFVGGSINGLEAERSLINDLTNKFNVEDKEHLYNNLIEERTFITVYSFSSFYGQSNQFKINKFIEEDIDFAIFLFDVASNKDKEDCIGKFTREELETVIKNNIQYEIFVKYCDDADANRILDKEIESLVSHFQFYNSIDKLEVILQKRLPKLLRKRVENTSWANDNFAYYTIEARMKEIFNTFLEQHKYDDFLNAKVYGLDEMSDLLDKAENASPEFREQMYIIGRELSSLTGEYLPAVYGEHHYEYIRRLPFLIAEFYFYYYILYLYLMNYSDKGDSATKKYLDLYESKKSKALTVILNDKENDKVQSKQIAVRTAFKVLCSEQYYKDDGRFKSALFHCVSTNSTDLSQLQHDHTQVKVSNRLIIDDTCKFQKFLLNKDKQKGKKAVYVLDNYGPEFLSDLLFGRYLIQWCGYEEVEYCVKQIPIFVSDTTVHDVENALSNPQMTTYLSLNADGNDETVKINTKDHSIEFIFPSGADVRRGRMVFTTSPEWHRPELFSVSGNIFRRWNVDENISLIVIKGDMNYRRLVGDKNYDYSDSIEDKICYINKNVLILRSLKSNVILGVESNDIKSVKPNWKTSGEYGIIHFIESDK